MKFIIVYTQAASQVQLVNRASYPVVLFTAVVKSFNQSRRKKSKHLQRWQFVAIFNKGIYIRKHYFY